MKIKLKIVIAALLIALSGYGIGRAQVADDADAFRIARYRAEDLGDAKAYGDLTNIVSGAPKSASATKQAIRYALTDGFKGKGSPSDAMIIAQNARIIELLEKLQK